MDSLIARLAAGLPTASGTLEGLPSTVVKSVGWGVPSDARDHGVSEGYGSTRQTKRSRRLGCRRSGSDKKEVEEVRSRRSGSERTGQRGVRLGIGEQESRTKRLWSWR